VLYLSNDFEKVCPQRHENDGMGRHYKQAFFWPFLENCKIEQLGICSCENPMIWEKWVTLMH